MAQDNIIDLTGRGEISDPLTELLRSGARQLLCQAVEAELEGFMAGYAGQETSRGHAAVVRNGHHPEREIQTGIGLVSKPIWQGNAAGPLKQPCITLSALPTYRWVNFKLSHRP